MAAEKIGIDTTNLPNIDLTNLGHATQEFIKKDFQQKIGLLTKVKNFFKKM